MKASEAAEAKSGQRYLDATCLYHSILNAIGTLYDFQ